MGLISWIIAGIVAGFIASKLMDGSGKGCLVDLILGVVGASFGGWLMSLVGISGNGGFIANIAVAVVGAVAILWIFNKLFK